MLVYRYCYILSERHLHHIIELHIALPRRPLLSFTLQYFVFCLSWCQEVLLCVRYCAHFDKWEWSVQKILVQIHTIQNIPNLKNWGHPDVKCSKTEQNRKQYLLNLGSRTYFCDS